MPRLFLGNFEFEHRLADPRGLTLSKRLRRINDELAFAWLTIAEDGDAIIVPERFEFDFFERAAEAGFARVIPVTADRAATDLAKVQKPSDWELVPWGWTDHIRAWGTARGFRCDAPPEAAVRYANSRQLSFTLESEWGVGLPGACAITSMESCALAIKAQSSDSQWVIKANFGMSGRERVVGAGRKLTDASAGWVSRRLARDGAVYFEPWVRGLNEAGLQLEVPESGPPRFLGVTQLLTDQNGVYRGSRFDSDQSGAVAYTDGIDWGMRVAHKLQLIGYFGPLGIDMMYYRHENGMRLRPIQDINARWTMGRLSLGCRRMLRPNEWGMWHHTTLNPSDVAADFEMLASVHPPWSRVVRTSPLYVDGDPVQRMTYLELISRRAEEAKRES